jgi:hypothetical protein
MAIIQPDTENRAQQRRYGDGPADESGHPKAKPDTLVSGAQGSLLSRCFRTDPPGEGIFFVGRDSG